jgi:hypothetical protein
LPKDANDGESRLRLPMLNVAAEMVEVARAALVAGEPVATPE